MRDISVFFSSLKLSLHTEGTTPFPTSKNTQGGAIPKLKANTHATVNGRKQPGRLQGGGETHKHIGLLGSRLRR